MCERELGDKLVWVLDRELGRELGIVATFSFKSLGHSCVQLPRSAIGRGGEGINGVRW